MYNIRQKIQWKLLIKNFIVNNFDSNIKQFITSMLVLLTVGLKCTLAVSHAALWRVTMSMPKRQMDGRTPDHYIMLSAMCGQHKNE